MASVRRPSRWMVNLTTTSPGSFHLLVPVACDLLHHQHEIVRAAEIGDVQRRAGAGAAAGREAEALSARAGVGHGVARPDFLPARRRLAAGVRRRRRRCRRRRLCRRRGLDRRFRRHHLGDRRRGRPDRASRTRRRFGGLDRTSADGRQAARPRAVAGAAERNRHHRFGRSTGLLSQSIGPEHEKRRPPRRAAANEIAAILARPSGSCRRSRSTSVTSIGAQRSLDTLVSMPTCSTPAAFSSEDTSISSLRFNAADRRAGRRPSWPRSPSSAGRAPGAPPRAPARRPRNTILFCR